MVARRTVACRPADLNHKDLRQLARKAIKRGWSLTHGGSGHILWWTPDGQLAASSTGSRARGRAYANTLAQLRRAGLDV